MFLLNRKTSFNLLDGFLFLLSIARFWHHVESTSDDTPSVQTLYGTIRGRTHFLESLSLNVDEYLSIPYAKPPIGNLRFQYPQPPDRWEGVLEATSITTPCWQVNDTMFGSDFRGSSMWNSFLYPSEDCLYLNVWVPKPSAALTKFAIMVWIHGGGYVSGSINLDVYDGKYLAALSNTIVVSMNYRLGPFGFFTLNDTQAPSNIGLRDQLMSLQWVQDNIASFGGDPNNVTIFGESAGAGSVSFHLLSPLSRDKFNRAIMQSGSSLMPYGVLTMSEALNISKTFLKSLHCLNESSDKIDDVNRVLTCLRNLPAETITEHQAVTDGILQFSFVPVVDGTFLPDYPNNLIERGHFKKCPILAGSNTNEGSYFLIYEFNDLLKLNSISMTDEQYESTFDKIFSYFPRYPRKLSETLLKNIKSVYNHSRSNNSDTEANIYALDMVVGDSQFVCPTKSFSHYYAADDQNVYYYYFNERIKQHAWPEWMGVLHGDEILFLISDVQKHQDRYTPDEVALSKEMISYWSNFAKTGDPNKNSEFPPSVLWPKFTTSGQEYLELNSSKISMGKELRKKECNFWENVYNFWEIVYNHETCLEN